MPINLLCRRVVQINRQTKVRNLFLTIFYQTLIQFNFKKPLKERAKRFQDPNIGLFLNDRYEVKMKLSKGSFGLVYLVIDTKIDIK